VGGQDPFLVDLMRRSHIYCRHPRAWPAAHPPRV